MSRITLEMATEMGMCLDATGPNGSYKIPLADLIEAVVDKAKAERIAGKKIVPEDRPAKPVVIMKVK